MDKFYLKTIAIGDQGKGLHTMRKESEAICKQLLDQDRQVTHAITPSDLHPLQLHFVLCVLPSWLPFLLPSEPFSGHSC